MNDNLLWKAQLFFLKINIMSPIECGIIKVINKLANAETSYSKIIVMYNLLIEKCNDDTKLPRENNLPSAMILRML